MCCVNVPRIATSGHGGHKPGETWKRGILRELSELGNLREFSEFCATSGKKYNK